MPAGNRTGPRGQGAMTGRGFGYCAGYSTPGYMNAGRPMGGNWGGGRGWRNMYYATGRPGWMRYRDPAYGSPADFPYPAPPTPEQETEMLKQQQIALKQQMDSIENRLSELSKKKE